MIIIIFPQERELTKFLFEIPFNQDSMTLYTSAVQ